MKPLSFLGDTDYLRGSVKWNSKKMKVCIAEKPSVAKELAQILGATSRKDGYYEGNGYRVTWTFGHLCTLKEPHDYLPDWKRWSLGTLPIIPSRFGIKLINDQGVIKQFRTIESIVKEAELVINCGDAGQEGEVIQRWVLQKANCQCPVKRLWISSLTEEAIREGFNKLYDGADFDRLYAAGSARAIGDWLLGINATRLYTLKYGQQGQVLSIGRVQTPTLALIVGRQKEIDNFVPQPYWELKTVYKEVVFNNSEGRYTNKDEAEKAIEVIRGKEFEITGFERKKGREAPPRLFDLTSLQVECNRKFSLSADETLKTIQSLYEKKLTSYPRVDTTFLSNDMYPKIAGIMKGLKPYESLTAPVLAKKITKSKKVFDDTKVTDHHAIIPTGQNPSSSLSRDEKLVFDMVTRRFIAAFYPDAIISTTTVEGKVETVNFKATGKQILDPAWRVVMKMSQGKSDDNVLPEFTKGERGSHEPDLQEKETQPPKPYTEATLLRAMETAGKQVDDEELRDAMKENGIGRPSTRAAIIETLFKRKYIIRNRKNLVPTITGMQLIDVIRHDQVKSAELTGLWEKKLREIENGTYDPADFMNELKQMVSDIVFAVRREPTLQKIEVVDDESKKKEDAPGGQTAASTQSSIKCPRCGEGVMLKGKQGWGCSRYKEGCHTVVPFTFMGKQLTDNQMETLLRKRKSSLIKGFEQGSEKMDGVLILDDNYQLQLQKEEDAQWLCPKCKEGLIIKGHSAYGCERYAQGCRVVIPFEFMGKKLTQKQIEDLILKGKTNVLKRFVDASGNAINGRLTWNADFKVVIEAS
jgi:DNA topoisomerase-3